MDSLPSRQLPIGIQTFREIRNGKYYYVDKTHYLRKLLDDGKHFFLSRPRRFGKSLLVDTIKELFEGNKKLFHGLHIYNRWDWSKCHPVLHLSLGGGHSTRRGDAQRRFEELLASAERRFEVVTEYSTAAGRLSSLLSALHEKSGHPVVVLVDEYDKPILDALCTPTVSRANRDFLRGVYAVIKDCDAHIRFSLFTGVTRLSKVSLFSGLNSLIDITMDPEYSAICGYVEQDLDTVFSPELAGLDRDKIRDWYDGYNWLGEDVYNPFDILLLFRRREFGAYWFETGTPTFLVQMLMERRVRTVDLGRMQGDSNLLSAFDVDHISTEALLFQTGYLTIAEKFSLAGMPHYRLDYPNRAVRLSLNTVLLRHLVKDETRQMANSVHLYELLSTHDLDGLRDLFRSFFASIPYEWYTSNDIARYEGYYTSVFYSYFAALGLQITVEDSMNSGLLDMAVKSGGTVFIFEFKVVEVAPRGAAMAQLREKCYASKYLDGHTQVYLVAVEFSKETRNIVAFETERA